MTVIEKIDDLIRRRAGYSAAALERDAKLAGNRISKIREGGGKSLRAAEALRIARVFGVPVEWLIDDETTELPRPEPVDQMTDAERMALKLVRELELAEGEVIRRLATPPTPAPPLHERIQPIQVPLGKPADRSPTKNPGTGRSRNSG